MSSKDLSRERFGRFASTYVASPTHARGHDLALIVEVAAGERRVVLDVATGGGHTALELAGHVSRVVATDLTPEMLVAAQAHADAEGVTDIEFAVADAEDLPFDEGSFDVVTCRIAAHHFEDVERFVSEAARVLVSGGLLLVQDQCVSDDPEAAEYVNAFERLRDPSHHQTLSVGEWERTLAEGGFEVERVEQLAKRHVLSEWAKMQECDLETVERLHGLLWDAPPLAREWMEPAAEGVEDTFAIRHVILVARSPG